MEVNDNELSLNQPSQDIVGEAAGEKSRCYVHGYWEGNSSGVSEMVVYWGM